MLEDTFAMADKHTMCNVVVEKIEMRGRLANTDIIVYLFDTKTLRKDVVFAVWDKQADATDFANCLRDAANDIDRWVRQNNGGKK